MNGTNNESKEKWMEQTMNQRNNESKKEPKVCPIKGKTNEKMLTKGRSKQR